MKRINKNETHAFDISPLSLTNRPLSLTNESLSDSGQSQYHQSDVLLLNSQSFQMHESPHREGEDIIEYEVFEDFQELKEKLMKAEEQLKIKDALIQALQDRVKNIEDRQVLLEKEVRKARFIWMRSNQSDASYLLFFDQAENANERVSNLEKLIAIKDSQLQLARNQLRKLLLQKKQNKESSHDLLPHADLSDIQVLPNQLEAHSQNNTKSPSSNNKEKVNRVPVVANMSPQIGRVRNCGLTTNKNHHRASSVIKQYENIINGNNNECMNQKNNTMTFDILLNGGKKFHHQSEHECNHKKNLLNNSQFNANQILPIQSIINNNNNNNQNRFLDFSSSLKNSPSISLKKQQFVFNQTTKSSLTSIKNIHSLSPSLATSIDIPTNIQKNSKSPQNRKVNRYSRTSRRISTQETQKNSLIIGKVSFNYSNNNNYTMKNSNDSSNVMNINSNLSQSTTSSRHSKNKLFTSSSIHRNSSQNKEVISIPHFISMNSEAQAKSPILTKENDISIFKLPFQGRSQEKSNQLQTADSELVGSSKNFNFINILLPR